MNTNDSDRNKAAEVVSGKVLSDSWLDIHDIPFIFFDQKQFKQALARETKRCELAGLHCVLMLIDMDELLLWKENDDPMDRISRMLLARKCIHSLRDVSREIDIKGWYRQGRVAGVIFTEVQRDDTAVFEQKMKASLTDILGDEKRGGVSVTCRFFECGKEGE